VRHDGPSGDDRDQLGDVVINTSQQDLRKEVKRVTDGRGVDFALDCVGSELAEQMITCLTDGGKMLLYGTLGGAAMALYSRDLMMANATIGGFCMPGWLAALSAAYVDAVVDSPRPPFSETDKSCRTAAFSPRQVPVILGPFIQTQVQPINTAAGGTQPQGQRTCSRQCRLGHRNPECVLLGERRAAMERANMTVIGRSGDRARYDQGCIPTQIFEAHYFFTWMEMGSESAWVGRHIKLGTVVQQAFERLRHTGGIQRRCFPSKSHIRGCPHLKLDEFSETLMSD
jgi:hypothetical protein